VFADAFRLTRVLGDLGMCRMDIDLGPVFGNQFCGMGVDVDCSVETNS
jgi:hypothetical protein